MEAGMKTVTAALKLVFLFCLVLPVLFGARLSIWWIALVSEKADRRARRGILKLWARIFGWAARIRIIREGKPPDPPFFLVANHVSYLDMMALTHQTGCVFISRGDVEHWPVFGQIAKSVYIIFINRSNMRDTVRVNRLIEHALRMGEGITLFAESRISRGIAVQPFKSALIQPAAALDLPVHYATITYETPENAPAPGRIVGWWRPEPLFRHMFRLLKYPGITIRIRFSEEPMRGSDRKELAKRLHAAVSEHFVSMDR
jgi:1-acyl-sn-glycerol-3-phosphate acyltransferase